MLEKVVFNSGFSTSSPNHRRRVLDLLEALGGPLQTLITGTARRWRGSALGCRPHGVNRGHRAPHIEAYDYELLLLQRNGESDVPGLSDEVVHLIEIREDVSVSLAIRNLA